MTLSAECQTPSHSPPADRHRRLMFRRNGGRTVKGATGPRRSGWKMTC